ncbi:MAG: hypothetical protein ACE5IL_06195 [Myxococcota bacterium]
MEHAEPQPAALERPSLLKRNLILVGSYLAVLALIAASWSS